MPLSFGIGEDSGYLMDSQDNTEFLLKIQTTRFKLSYFEHIMWRHNSLEKAPMLGKVEKRRQG